MGCHTWFYKLLEKQPTKEEKIHSFIKHSSEFCDKCKEALKNGGFIYNNKKDWYPFDSEEEVSEHINMLNWMIENAPKYEEFKSNYDSIDWNSDIPLTKEQQLYIDVENYTLDNAMVISHAGKYYENLSNYTDVFRYHEYGKILTSKEETYELLESNNCWKDDKTYEYVNEFWEKYPDGIIELG